MAKDLRFHFVVAVWGSEHLQLFCDVILPNHLSGKNYEALIENKSSIKYKIYTLSSDYPQLQSAKSFQLLKETVPVEVVSIDKFYLENVSRYLKVNAIHRHAICSAENEGAAFVFLTPDLVWNDGAFKKMIELAHQGSRVVLVKCLSGFYDGLLSEYQNIIPQHSYKAIHSRELVRAVLKHIHSKNIQWTWDAVKPVLCPAHIHWFVGDEGFISRSLHLHPLLVNPLKKGYVPKVTIDYDWIHKSSPDLKSIHVIQDSDEIFAAEFRKPENKPDLSHGEKVYIRKNGIEAFMWYKLHKIALWIKARAFAYHRHSFLNYSIRIHTCGDFSEKWEVEQEKSNQFIEIIHSDVKFGLLFRVFGSHRHYMSIIKSEIFYFKLKLLRMRFKIIAHVDNLLYYSVVSQSLKLNFGFKTAISSMVNKCMGSKRA